MTQRMRGTVKIVRDSWGFINTRNKDIGDVFVAANDVSGGSLEKDITVEFEIREDNQGRKRAYNVNIVSRNVTKFNTEDKQLWCKEGEKLEEAFVREIAPKIGRKLIIHPQKKFDKTFIDLLNLETKEIADLKSQNTPFFTAKSIDNSLDPTFTVTFNKKDYEHYITRYKDQINKLKIYFCVNWTQLEWKNEHITRNVEPLNGVWEADFDDMKELIENSKVKLHEYQNRTNDDENAKDSYLFDLRNNIFTKLL